MRKFINSYQCNNLREFEFEDDQFQKWKKGVEKFLYFRPLGELTKLWLRQKKANNVIFIEIFRIFPITERLMYIPFFYIEFD